MRQKVSAKVIDRAELLTALMASSDKPSLDRSRAWHVAVSPSSEVTTASNKTGKWCIFVSADKVDDAWARVKPAVQAGRLHAAKVSTAYAAWQFPAHVICVYTPDWNDRKSIEESRAVLRDLGFVEELGYKRDIETLSGVYNSPDEWFIRI